MITRHLSEKEIQEYTLNKPGCEGYIIEHVEGCEKCRIKAATYQLIFSEIKQQSKPVFDFELGALVLSQIPAGKAKFSFDALFVYFLALVIFSSIAISVYLFRVYLLNMITGISSLFFYTIITATLPIMIFKSIAMHKKYQQKIYGLNIS